VTERIERQCRLTLIRGSSLRNSSKGPRRRGGTGRPGWPAHRVDQERAGERAGGAVERSPGYGKHDAVGRDGDNSRNGTRTKIVLTEIGPVEVDVPRDRDGSFDLTIVLSGNVGWMGSIGSGSV
jgi:hypothetical protein